MWVIWWNKHFFPFNIHSLLLMSLLGLLKICKHNYCLQQKFRSLTAFEYKQIFYLIFQLLATVWKRITWIVTRIRVQRSRDEREVQLGRCKKKLNHELCNLSIRSRYSSAPLSSGDSDVFLRQLEIYELNLFIYICESQFVEFSDCLM